MTQPSTAAPWAIVLPVKELDRAKTRLSARTSAVRRALAMAFALDVVTVCLACPEVARVTVVTADPAVAQQVLDLGAHCVLEPVDSGLNESLTMGAADSLAAAPHLHMALLAADLPALRPRDLREALALAGQVERSFVSDVAGTGTTFLAAAPGLPIEPQFGPRSRAAHAAAGFVELTAADLTRLRCDVDTEVDLWHAVQLGVGPYTSAALATSSGNS